MKIKMKFLNIREYNIKELVHEGELFSDDKNLFYGIPKEQKKGKLGFVNFHVRNIPGFTVTEWENLFYEDIKIAGYNAEAALSLHFMTDGLSSFKLKNSETIVANNGTNNLWSLNNGYFGHQVCKKNTYCASLGIYMHNNSLEDLTNKYPDLLGEIYRRYVDGETFFLKPEYQSTTMEMVHIISQIRHAKLMGNASDIYTEAKILELLAIQLQQDIGCAKDVCNKYCLKKCDIDKIHEAKIILLKKLNNPPSIRELAKQVGSNEYKLKCGFKEVYKQTVYGYLFEHKMDLAQRLLLDTDKTILEVAFECGYGSSSHFTHAFKRKYGINPREFRNRA